MARWSILRRSKATKETNLGSVSLETNTPAQHIIGQQENPGQKDVPVMEYNEELYAQGTPVKKQQARFESRREPMQRTSWEDPCTIERNVDRIGTKDETLATNSQVSDQIERKVDRLIAKKKLER
ncbi:MAG TPA: hypothetical protein VMT57_00140 [Candidatus Thermoplasmatota archaeon]|nr:hypothetical protein [Candidatus Thermoplasmatota archaeon]